MTPRGSSTTKERRSSQSSSCPFCAATTHGPSWLQINVALRPQNGSFAEPAYRLFEAVTSLVKDLEKSGQLQSYFFMRKDPGLRLRFCLGAGAGGAISAVE